MQRCIKVMCPLSRGFHCMDCLTFFVSCDKNPKSFWGPLIHAISLFLSREKREAMYRLFQRFKSGLTYVAVIIILCIVILRMHHENVSISIPFTNSLDNYAQTLASSKELTTYKSNEKSTLRRGQEENDMKIVLWYDTHKKRMRNLTRSAGFSDCVYKNCRYKKY